MTALTGAGLRLLDSESDSLESLTILGSGSGAGTVELRLPG